MANQPRRWHRLEGGWDREVCEAGSQPSAILLGRNLCPVISTTSIKPTVICGLLNTSHRPRRLENFFSRNVKKPSLSVNFYATCRNNAPRKKIMKARKCSRDLSPISV